MGLFTRLYWHIVTVLKSILLLLIMCVFSPCHLFAINNFTNLPPYKSDITSTNIDRKTAEEVGRYCPEGLDVSYVNSDKFPAIMSSNQPFIDKALRALINLFTSKD